MGPQAGEERVKVTALQFKGSSNYTNWAWALKQALKSNDVWGVVTEDKNELGYEEAPAAGASKEVISKYGRADATALDLIAKTLPEVYFSYVVHARDARDAWRVFRETFGKVSPAALRALKAELNALRAKACQPLDVFFCEVQQVVAKIRNVEQLSDEDPKYVILNGVPAVYKEFVSGMEGAQAASGKSLSLGLVMEALKTEESRLMSKGELSYGTSVVKKQQEGESAMQSTRVFPREVWPRKKKRSMAKAYLSVSVSPCKGGESRKKRIRRCFHCDGEDHLIRNCGEFIKLKMGLPKASVSRTKKVVNVMPNVVKHSGAVERRERGAVDFIFDSGASIHIVVEKALLMEYEVLTDGPLIEAANGKKMRAVGVGKICISPSEACRGAGVGDLAIGEVYYVPGLKHNLLSLSVVCNRGYEVRLNKSKCSLLKPDGDLICSGVRGEDSMYWLSGTAVRVDRAWEKPEVARTSVAIERRGVIGSSGLAMAVDEGNAVCRTGLAKAVGRVGIAVEERKAVGRLGLVVQKSEMKRGRALVARVVVPVGDQQRGGEMTVVAADEQLKMSGDVASVGSEIVCEYVARKCAYVAGELDDSSTGGEEEYVTSSIQLCEYSYGGVLKYTSTDNGRSRWTPGAVGRPQERGVED